MLKPCYVDTESQFSVTARTATGNGQVNQLCFFIYLLTEKTNSKWLSNEHKCHGISYLLVYP